MNILQYVVVSIVQCINSVHRLHTVLNLSLRLLILINRFLILKAFKSSTTHLHTSTEHLRLH